MSGRPRARTAVLLLCGAVLAGVGAGILGHTVGLPATLPPPTTPTAGSTPPASTTATGDAADPIAAWRIAPGALGPLRIGGSVAQAQRNGWLVAGADGCGRNLKVAPAIEAALGRDGLALEWRYFSSADKIDALLVKSPKPATTTGVRVGSTVAEVLAAYGTAEYVNDFGELHDQTVLLVWDAPYALAFHVAGSAATEKVAAIETLYGTSRDQLQTVPWSC